MQHLHKRLYHVVLSQNKFKIFKSISWLRSKPYSYPHLSGASPTISLCHGVVKLIIHSPLQTVAVNYSILPTFKECTLHVQTEKVSTAISAFGIFNWKEKNILGRPQLLHAHSGIEAITNLFLKASSSIHARCNYNFHHRSVASI